MRAEQGGFAARSAMALVLACALCCLGPVGAGLQAWADEAGGGPKTVEDAQAALDRAEAHMKEISESYDVLKQEVDDLQARIDEGAAQAKEAQKAVVEGRSSLSKTAVYQYRSGSKLSFLSILLESRDFGELTRNMAYLGSVMQYQADEISAQKKRSADFDDMVSKLNSQKNEQDIKLEELDAKRGEAEQLVDKAQASLKNAQNDQAARLEALRQQAAGLGGAGGGAAPGIVENANTIDRVEVVPDDAPVQPNPRPPAPPAPAPPPRPNPAPAPTPSPAPHPGGAWSTGVASAYGGSTDPYTPNPGTTATGAVCDDNSMGVAVPMAWPNYRSYFGRTVEISYNGQTVYATVNDCGGMGGGSRSLDLQPGVWKAFGFTSCLGWGLRTVSYRFL